MHPQGKKGVSFMALKIYCFLLEELLYSSLNPTAMLAQHEYSCINNHVTLLFYKLWKPKSDCIQLWVVGDTLKACLSVSKAMIRMKCSHVRHFTF